MSIHHIPYQETGYYSKLICDYLEQKDALKSFYGNFPNLENFKEQIEQKQFAEENREVLVKAVRNQYKNIDYIFCFFSKKCLYLISTHKYYKDKK